VEGFANVLRHETVGTNIRILVHRPGTTLTEFHSRRLEYDSSSILPKGSSGNVFNRSGSLLLRWRRYLLARGVCIRLTRIGRSGTGFERKCRSVRTRSDTVVVVDGSMAKSSKPTLGSWIKPSSNVINGILATMLYPMIHDLFVKDAATLSR
jgi:hypothetical protein